MVFFEGVCLKRVLPDTERGNFGPGVYGIPGLPTSVELFELRGPKRQIDTAESVGLHVWSRASGEEDVSVVWRALSLVCECSWS
jgi:hypothetical protein